jgi:hypothetical protein
VSGAWRLSVHAAAARPRGTRHGSYGATGVEREVLWRLLEYESERPGCAGIGHERVSGAGETKKSVDGMAVKCAGVAIVMTGCPRISVTRRVLNVAERDAVVEGEGDERGA